MSPKKKQPRPHRAQVWKSADGWRYHVKAGNGKIVEASEEGLVQRKRVLDRIEKNWPDAIVTVVT